ISLLSGTRLPSIIRSRNCKARVSASTCVTMNVVAAFLPSCKVDVVLRLHLLPSLLQVPSPKPPLASNIHDRSCFVVGSQPIHWVAPPTEVSRNVDVNVASRKFWLSAQVTDSRSTWALLPSSAQSPTAHSRPRKCS